MMSRFRHSPVPAAKTVCRLILVPSLRPPHLLFTSSTSPFIHSLYIKPNSISISSFIHINFSIKLNSLRSRPSMKTPPALLLISLLCFHLIPLSTAAGDTNSSNTTDSYGDLKRSTLDPSIGVVIVVLICAFFMTGCIATYITGCGAGAVAAPSYSRFLIPGVSSSQQGCRRSKPGLDRSEIDSFPTFVYSDVKKLQIGKRALECAVCLAEFKDEESLRLLPKCEHAFHPECIDPWLSVRSSCPLCRSDLVPIAAEIRAAADSIPPGDESEEEEEVVVKRNPDLAANFVRSNSTGHSMIIGDRFRLRLPEEMRRQIVVEANMRRAKSFGTLPRVPSSRKGYRSGGEEGNSQSGRFLRWTGLVKGDREIAGTSSDAILVAIVVN